MEPPTVRSMDGRFTLVMAPRAGHQGWSTDGHGSLRRWTLCPGSMGSLTGSAEGDGMARDQRGMGWATTSEAWNTVQACILLLWQGSLCPLLRRALISFQGADRTLKVEGLRFDMSEMYSSKLNHSTATLTICHNFIQKYC